MALWVIFLLVFLDSTAYGGDTAVIGGTALEGEILEAKLKLKLAQLESNLEKRIQELSGKSLYIEECEKKIEEMNLDIDSLKTLSASLEDDYMQEIERLSALKEELQILWAASRKNNFEIHMLEHKVQGAEARLNVVKSQVEEMDSIVSEQWIQIQQLEQGVQMTQYRALKVKRQLRAARCPYVKFITDVLGENSKLFIWIFDPYVNDWIYNLESCISEAPGFLRKTFSAAKHYHHQLQGYIKQSLLRSEITAVLVNEEVVFFVASVLVTFPVLCIFALLSSRLA